MLAQRTKYSNFDSFHFLANSRQTAAALADAAIAPTGIAIVAVAVRPEPLDLLLRLTEEF